VDEDGADALCADKDEVMLSTAAKVNNREMIARVGMGFLMVKPEILYFAEHRFVAELQIRTALWLRITGFILYRH
jgi:hypothetical protein